MKVTISETVSGVGNGYGADLMLGVAPVTPGPAARMGFLRPSVAAPGHVASAIAEIRQTLAGPLAPGFFAAAPSRDAPVTRVIGVAANLTQPMPQFAMPDHLARAFQTF